jgi:hypothetical protein
MKRAGVTSIASLLSAWLSMGQTQEPTGYNIYSVLGRVEELMKSTVHGIRACGGCRHHRPFDLFES